MRHVVVVRVVEQRLGRDAAHVEAGAAARVVLLNADGLGGEIGRVDLSRLGVQIGNSMDSNRIRVYLGFQLTG